MSDTEPTDLTEVLFLAKMITWATAHPEKALDFAMLILADQCSVISPEQITATDDEGNTMRVEVYRGHHVAQREAQLKAYNSLAKDVPSGPWN